MIEKAKSIVALAQHCTAGGDSLRCGPFWYAAGALVLAIIALASLTWIAVLLRQRARSRRTNELWEAEMQRREEVAPELRIQHEKWKGDAGVEQDEKAMADQIRAALQSRRTSGHK